jgi:multimeric flavodoxin WrbA
MQKIIGLSCGRKNGYCESLLKEAAMGAEEFGIQTEIIRAMSLKVLPCTGCNACFVTGACVLKDDVEWILEKTHLEDAALIVSVPCYHIRANAYFMCIADRTLHMFLRCDYKILEKTRVGAIIGVGGGGYDAWTTLTLPTVNIFLQETRLLVDQMQVNYCRMKEWNPWLMKGVPREPNKVRAIDLTYEDLWKATAPQPASKEEFHKAATGRARELGRNVARAMQMPIQDVRYLGEDTPVSCPVCHCNVVVVPDRLPHIGCPVCWVRGTISTEGGEMKVIWNMEDAKLPRLSQDGIRHHHEWLHAHAGGDLTAHARDLKELERQYGSYGTIIKPE